MWHDIRHPAKPTRLLFRYDPDRQIVQVQDRGEKYTIDLSEFTTQKDYRQPPKTVVSCEKDQVA